jgi:aromatase/bifunctional cyclase/aromatase
MAATGKHRTTHEIEIEAPADLVYGIIADATAWPLHFAPTIHVERTDLGGGAERLRIWATANQEVRNWTSRRELDPAERRVTFRQEVSTAPVAAMGGEWQVTDLGAGRTGLVLLHDFDAVGDTAENVDWDTRATDRNSHAELGNIKNLAENWAHQRELVFSFEDSVLVQGDAAEVYDFLYDAKRWQERLPHVGRIDLREDVANIQSMTMLTVIKDGSTHSTESVRVCFPDSHRIVYKQLVPPSLMAAHLGEWTFVGTPEGVLATSRHTVTINEANIAKVLGPERPRRGTDRGRRQQRGHPHPRQEVRRGGR